MVKVVERVGADDRSEVRGEVSETGNMGYFFKRRRIRN